MTTLETGPFDESRLSATAREFASQVLARHPEFRRHAELVRESPTDRWRLRIVVPAPSEDPKAALCIWTDGVSDEPSVEFCDWHTHESVWAATHDDGPDREAILGLIDGIVADRFIGCEEIGGIGRGSTTILDLSLPDALLDELTNRYSTGRARCRSWSGRLDRVVDLDDLN